MVFPVAGEGAEFQLKLRRVIEEPAGSGNLKRAYETQAWNPAETAVIICDTWDAHHCLNAVRRLEEPPEAADEEADAAAAAGGPPASARASAALSSASAASE